MVLCKRLPLYSFFILLLSCFTVYADDTFDFNLNEQTEFKKNWRFSNTLESRNRKFTHQQRWLSTRQRLNSSLLYEQEAWKAYINTYLDYDPSTHRYQPTTRADLNEAYVVFHGSAIDLPATQLTIGKQRITWGTTDGRSTIDLLNATYLRDPIANGRTIQKRPSWLMRLEQQFSFGAVDLVVMPFGRERKLPKYGSPWEPESFHQLREYEKSGLIQLTKKYNPHKPELGARFTQYNQGYDWGFAYFEGYSDLPAAKVKGNNHILLEPTKQRTWNINAAISQNSNTYRIETAYTDQLPVYDKQGLLYFSELQQVILGWDRNFNDNLYANIQLFWDHYPNYKDNYGATFAVNKPFFNDTLTLGVSGFYGYNNEHSVETYAEYAYNDHWTFIARLYVLGGGHSQSLFRSYANNDFIELGFRYFF